MSPAHVVEPTYERLKRDLLEGKWRQGARLEAMRLADDFGVSMTPVRDCLNRLAGEGLVDMRPGHGYHVPSLTEKELRDLLQSSAALLDFAVTCERPDIRPAPPKI
ncbi:MAG: GntR family transcriptional regulator, partial [Rhodobacteraceae bacterium]|nr:GntR family transcriptional regulator [Paracoccaceae bacterium]